MNSERNCSFYSHLFEKWQQALPKNKTKKIKTHLQTKFTFIQGILIIRITNIIKDEILDTIYCVKELLSFFISSMLQVQPRRSHTKFSCLDHFQVQNPVAYPTTSTKSLVHPRAFHSKKKNSWASWGIKGTHILTMINSISNGHFC